LDLDAGKAHSNNPGYSSQAWARNADLYEAIRTMPFNAELAAGTLSEERFRHYITQDAHYLVGFGRALALEPVRERVEWWG
jgi:thiaminase/transcriptional activator TenA